MLLSTDEGKPDADSALEILWGRINHKRQSTDDGSSLIQNPSCCFWSASKPPTTTCLPDVHSSVPLPDPSQSHWGAHVALFEMA